jgi:hypothetical protein
MAANATSWSIVAASCCEPKCTLPTSRTVPGCRCCSRVLACNSRAANICGWIRLHRHWQELDRGTSRLARGSGSASSASARRMGPTWQPCRLADGMVFIRATTTRSESLPWCSSPTVGRGADLCLALSEPASQSRLRAPVHHQRGTHPRGHGPPDGPQIGPKLTSQTVFRYGQEWNAVDDAA